MVSGEDEISTNVRRQMVLLRRVNYRRQQFNGKLNSNETTIAPIAWPSLAPSDMMFFVDVFYDGNPHCSVAYRGKK